MHPENSIEQLMPPTPPEPPESSTTTTDEFGAGIDIDSSKSAAQPDACREKMANGAAAHSAETSADDDQLLGHLPAEIAMLLVLAGVAGMVLPGPVGTPLLIAGGVTLWPRTFKPIEKWFNRRFPAAHREGVIQIHRFIDDLNRRFPELK